MGMMKEIFDTWYELQFPYEKPRLILVKHKILPYTIKNLPKKWYLITDICGNLYVSLKGSDKYYKVIYKN